jgi:hypothetical protein
MSDIEHTKARFVRHQTYVSKKSVHLLCRLDTRAAPSSLSSSMGAVKKWVKTFCEMRQEFQGAALQLLPDRAQPPRLFPPPLIFRTVGCALHINSSLLCPQAVKQEYDQVISMFPALLFRKQAVFATQIVPAHHDLMQAKFPVLPQPGNIQIEQKFPQYAREWPIAL